MASISYENSESVKTLFHLLSCFRFEVTLVRVDVSEEIIAFFIRVKRISELRVLLAVNS
jgi:hypothetical protein